MAFNSSKNYYEILGVNVDSDIAEIKSAYRKLARKYHPDINNEKDAIAKFKDITEAYEILSNPKSREQYNIVKGFFKSEQTTTSSQKAEDEYLNAKSKSEKYTTEVKPSSKEQPKKKINEHSILKNLKYWFVKIKKNQHTKEIKKPKKGDNIITEVTISPEEVLTGSKRIINVRTTLSCPKCHGHRFVNGGKCSECSGKGEITRTKKITVTIPKGIKDGAKLRLKNEGASGRNGGPCGDLFIIIKIETKTQVHFDKLNIYYNVPITPFEAALGEEITIPSFDGKIKLKLPPNTCSGQKFRIAKQGIKKNGKIGDLIITVSIEFSHDLSDDEIKLYKELKNLSNEDMRKNFGYGN
ncbi:DnaJ domain-containing protein [bacterium]|nr:DnaJ domain-containing protein [bacterium]